MNNQSKQTLRIDLWSPNPEQTGGVQQYSKGLAAGLQDMAEVNIVPLNPGGWTAKLQFVIHAMWSLVFSRPDIIWCTHLHLARASLLPRLLRLPIWVSLHGIDCWDIDDPRDMASLENAARLLCVSHYTMNRVASTHPAIKNKLQWFPNHLSHIPELAPDRTTAREKLKLPPDALVLLTISRLSSEEQYKGHREVLNALVTLHEKFPHLHYLIVGSGDDLPALRKLSYDLNVDSHVTFTGKLSDDELDTAYTAADLFVLSGKGEGFGIVLLDALVRGIPVLASSEDGSRDAVCNGKMGDMASPTQQDSVLNELSRILLLISQEQYPLKAEELRKQVIENYGPEARNFRLRELLSKAP